MMFLDNSTTPSPGMWATIGSLGTAILTFFGLYISKVVGKKREGETQIELAKINASDKKYEKLLKEFLQLEKSFTALGVAYEKKEEEADDFKNKYLHLKNSMGLLKIALKRVIRADDEVSQELLAEIDKY